jgi:hypothetical protein
MSSSRRTVWFAVTSTPLRQRMPLEGTRCLACTATTDDPDCSAAAASSCEKLEITEAISLSLTDVARTMLLSI